MAGVIDNLDGAEVRVTSLPPKRRRAGFGFTREPIVLAATAIGATGIVQLLGDPELKVELGAEGQFGLPSDAVLDELLTALREMADAEHAEVVASDEGKAARDARAPIGGGQTGSGFARELDQVPAPPGEGAGTLQPPEPVAAADLATTGLAVDARDLEPAMSRSATPAELADVRGIGAATAKKLTDAGIASVSAFAELDPASPPTVAGLPRSFDWAATIADARSLVSPPADAPLAADAGVDTGN